MVCPRMSTSQHCGTSTCFCSWQTKIFTPHSSTIITAAATCFDEVILDTEMYEQSLGIHSCVYGEIYPSLGSESSSPRRTGEPDSYVYGHLKIVATTKNGS
jgi:hypothetical protein